MRRIITHYPPWQQILTGWRQAGLCVAVALLGACAGVPLAQVEPPALSGHGPVAPSPDVDVLHVTDGMRSFVDRYVPEDHNDRLRLDLLMLAVRDAGVLGFHYNDAQTLTAEEAFQRRSGNCIAFANLFIALAREAGLDARYQEVFVQPEYSSRGDLVLQSRHVNVLVEGGGYAFMVDVSGEDVSMASPREKMSDGEARAMYFNNLGAEALIRGDHPGAYAHFLRAVRIEPTLPDVWLNLGVLYGRNGQWRDAELVYRHTLALDPREMAALGNLYDLYVQQDRPDEAEEIARRVERHRLDNPYYLLGLADEAIDSGDFGQAEKWLSRAIGLKGTEHRLHFAMARVHYLSGRPVVANESLERARALAPPEHAGGYRRPLEELVFRDQRTLPDEGPR